MSNASNPGSEARLRRAPPATVAHTWMEDIYGLIVGATCLVLGLMMLRTAGLVTGGVAGMALLVSYISHWSVGTLMVAFSLPFLAFAYMSMGRTFAFKTLVLNCGIAVALHLMPNALRVELISVPFAALVGGTLCGMGALALARHGAGVGGVGIVALWLQRRRGVNAGRFQTIVDGAILLAATPFVPPTLLAWSVGGVLAINAMIAAWHREDLYLGR